MTYRVVIGDDEGIIRMDLGEMLREAGHHIVGEAADGVQALALVREKRPDIVLLDIRMPKLDGIHAARMIGYEHIAPVVLLTAYHRQDMVMQAGESGVFGYLVKPISGLQLFPAMEIAIAQFLRQEKAYQQLQEMNERMETRKLVEQAKGIMIRRLAISEEEAYRRLQQYSMQHRQPLKEVAQLIVQQVAREKVKK
ncbi:response regulator [Megasphaera hutchinsoni]|uniref:Response regulator n=1 Tax=Megasphaera hutchinsoni TaxID=1588748 RepID=A0A2J8B7G4_9FIRM|nr:response regulator [Megasphaera genomosp. type_2]PNH20690.1 response regulator [Megasphaera genomosp. type_2]